MSARSILCWSLILNLLLAVWIVGAMVSRPAVSIRTADAAPIPPQKPSAHASADQSVSASSASTLVPGPSPFHWREIESPDFEVYVANLRRIGCPEPVLRNILSAELDDLYTRKRQELLRPLAGEVWDLVVQALRDPKKLEENLKPRIDPIEKSARELRHERDAVLEELLGNPPAVTKTPTDRPSIPPAHLANYLTQQKQAAVQELERKYAQQLNEARRRRSGDSAADPQARMRELEAQKQSELQTLLTTDEFAEYQLRVSSASRLPSTVYRFDAAEAEWHQLAVLQKAFDDANPPVPRNAADAEARRQEREQALNRLNEQMKAVLGPERFEAFRLAQQPDFKDLQRVVERCELPLSMAETAHSIRKTAETTAQQWRSDATMGPEERALALEALRSETEQALRSALGSRAYQTYENYRPDWAKAIAPSE